MKAFRVGLTGGIASGKSLALAEFARLGVKVVSLDEVSREVTRPGSAGARRIRRAFGMSFFKPDGALDRRRLAERVFSRDDRRRRLEGLLHPLILDGMERRVARVRGVAVVDVPLLFEAGLGRRFDATLLVTAPRPERLRRAARRDGTSRREVRRRMAAQWTDRAKAARADVVVENAGTKAEFRKRIREYGLALKLLSHGQRAR